MRQYHQLLVILPFILLTACHAVAEIIGFGDAQAIPTESTTFFTLTSSHSHLGILIWLAIFFWAIALLPLGVISIVHCRSLDTTTWPLATKLLACAPLFLIVHGWLGAAHGLMRVFMTVSGPAPDLGLFTLETTHSLYSLVATLVLVLLYLTALLISFVIIHFRHKKISGRS